MGLATGILAISGAAYSWQSYFKAAYQVRTRPDEVQFTQTKDGWRLALCRYQPKGETSRQHPIVICHGLGCSHFAFDLSAKKSFARYLSQQGFDVWLLDLRGHGYSEKPSFFTEKNLDWNFDDYVEKDVPAALNHVQKVTGKDVHWIGHSMGGLLYYSHVAIGGKQIRSAITVGSSLDYSTGKSEFHLMSQLSPLLSVIPGVPLGQLGRLMAPFSGRFHNPIDRFMFWPSNVAGELQRLLLSSSYYSVPRRVLEQLSTAMEKGGLRSFDGQTRYKDGLSKVSVPTLAIVGDQDKQCPPESAQDTVSQIKDHEILTLGKQYGQANSYGHFDPFLGLKAETEVYPSIMSWLEKNDR